MKKYIFFLLLIATISCKSTRQKEDVRKTETFIEYHKNGKIKAIGNTLLLSDVDIYTKKVSKIRNGYWHEFYENGQLKEFGIYKLDIYKFCGPGGLDVGKYSYKIGEWVYFDVNGNIRAKGEYKIGKKNIGNSCNGGYNINFGFVTDDWEFYDSKGNKIVPSKNDINEIEESGYLIYMQMEIDYKE